MHPDSSIGVIPPEHARMAKVTCTIVLTLIGSIEIMVAVGWLSAWTQNKTPSGLTHIADERPCQDKISKDHVEYCGSVQLGMLKLTNGRFSSMVNVYFASNAFQRLECNKTWEGWRCIKSGQPMLEYPSEFSILVEPLQVVETQSLVPTPPFRLRPELQPRRVMVRWLDANKRILAEQCTKLDEQVEAWTELQQPRLWYRAKVNGLSAVLASAIEAEIIGDKDYLLGTLRFGPNAFGAPLVPASLFLERK